ncbi:hypothetical protein BELL_0165g00080 [Botrytis elliptica]|uniref:Uncharacterized protein n=1 Tax=Botrytis elliptica TaxID=278938 RepID=A0A4Z1K4H0_9HELO|nr:hypothetical protein BELL_0165g00080 [Botrytis elliptica]
MRFASSAWDGGNQLFNTMSILSHFSLPTRRAFRTGLLTGASGFLTPAIMNKWDVSVLRAVFYVLILYTVFAGCEAVVYWMVEWKDVGKEEEDTDKRGMEAKREARGECE